jgi:hypothetical protein
MLIALAIGLIASLFGGGPEEIFQVPKLEKQIKSHVENEDFQNQLLTLTKEAKKELKSFNKSRSKKMKAMKKANASRESSEEMMVDLYMAYHNERLILYASLLAKRLEFQDLMTEDEWKNVIEKAVFPSDKATKSSNKADLKEVKEIDKIFTKIKEAIEKNIGESENREKVLTELDSFEKTIDEFVSMSQELNYQDSELVRKKTATAGELKNLYQQQNDLRVKGAMEFFRFREAAIKNTTDKEWKDIVAELKVIFN